MLRHSPGLPGSVRPGKDEFVFLGIGRYVWAQFWSLYRIFLLLFPDVPWLINEWLPQGCLVCGGDCFYPPTLVLTQLTKV